MIITPNNWSLTLTTMVMMDGLKLRERTSGVTDTLLQEPDITKNVEKMRTFVPGEGNKPLGVFIDKDCIPIISNYLLR